MSSFLASVALFAGQQAARLLIGLAISIVVARYLGPESFGLLSLAMVTVTILQPLQKLGPDGIAMRELVRADSDGGEVLSAVVGLRLVGAAVQASLALLIAIVMQAPGHPLVLMVAVVSASRFVAVGDVWELWLRSRRRPLSITAVRVVAVLGRGVLVGLLVVFAMDVMWFAFGPLTELAIALVGFVTICRSDVRPARFSARRAYAYAREGLPFMFAGVAGAVYQRVDILMLGKMTTVEETGLYSAAARILEALFFFATAVDWAAQSRLLKDFGERIDEFWADMKAMATGMAVIGYAMMALLIWLAPAIIHYTVGPKFAASAPILALLAPALLFVHIRLPRGYWMLTHRFGRLALVANIVGALINVALNIVLIPRYGPEGAAVATVVSYAFAFWGSSALYRAAWPVALIQTRGLLLLDLPLAVRRTGALLRAHLPQPL